MTDTTTTAPAWRAKIDAYRADVAEQKRQEQEQKLREKQEAEELYVKRSEEAAIFILRLAGILAADELPSNRFRHSVGEYTFEVRVEQEDYKRGGWFRPIEIVVGRAYDETVLVERSQRFDLATTGLPLATASLAEVTNLSWLTKQATACVSKLLSDVDFAWELLWDAKRVTEQLQTEQPDTTATDVPDQAETDQPEPDQAETTQPAKPDLTWWQTRAADLLRDTLRVLENLGWDVLTAEQRMLISMAAYFNDQKLPF